MTELSTVSIGARTVSYRARGEGPVVVLIHGMASSSETWVPLLDRMADHARVIAVDLPGIGGSSNPGGDYSLGAQASAIRDLMVSIGVERATLVGHSYGGGVAMQAAYQFPERCERLVLVSSGGLGREVAGLLRFLSLPGSEVVLSVGCSDQVMRAGGAVIRALGRIGLQPTASTAAIGRSYASLATPEARKTLLRTLRAVIGVDGQRVSAADRLGLAGAIPTMIVWGDRDRIIPAAHARAAHELIPGSTLEIMPGAGHFPHHDDAARFVRILHEFIGRTEPARLTDEQVRSLITP